ncbi:MAG: nitroreductase [Erysipelotrichaceae bacterium]|nr:nitroreductase [Erysipelotrichaceae bacterium]
MAMNNELYPMIFKRKSFHLFRNVGKERIPEEDLEMINTVWHTLEPLYPDIRTTIRILPAEQVHFKRDAEYCILIYSEKKDNWLMNAGYLGEQLDLYLTSLSIGTLWFGIGKPDLQSYDGLEYVIMIAVHKVSNDSLFRKDMYKARRKPVSEIWTGDPLDIAEIAGFSPSACNTQPWYVKNEEGLLTVYRYRKPGKRGIMPAAAVGYYNRIDIGIFLCILEICMAEKEIVFTRELFIDEGDEQTEYSKVAEYRTDHLKSAG